MRRVSAVLASIRFYGDELVNLHHFLYAWAWRTRAEGRPLSQRLAAVPTAPFTAEERTDWTTAVASLRDDVVPRLETLFATIWFTTPDRADIVAFTPAIEGMFPRAWPQYRPPVSSAWAPYVEGRATLDAAIAQTVAALGAPK
jgi:hypothetical protein